MEHLKELKKRLFYVLGVLICLFLVCFFCISDALLSHLLAHYKQTFQSAAPEKPFYFIFTTLPEAFVLKVKISFYAALITSVPYLEYQIWRFVSPGLYTKERKNILMILLSFPFFFILGNICLFWLVLPNALAFFAAFSHQSAGDHALLLPNVSDYTALIFTFLGVFGLSFQLPLLLVFLVKTSLLSMSSLIHFRRFAIIFIFLLAAFLTPPDVLSQVGLAIPLLALYEGTILYLRMTQKESHD